MPPEIAKLLWDMHTAATRIERFTSGRSFDDYQRDDMLRSAVERQFEIIGEAMVRLIKTDPQTASRISEHRRITGFRNVLIHGYDAIDDAVSWAVVQEKLPLLQRELAALLPDMP